MDIRIINLFFICVAFVWINFGGLSKAVTISTVQNMIKITPPIPVQIEQCFIERITSASAPFTAISCASLCKPSENCRFSCFKGNECRLYSARMSKYYTQTGTGLLEYRCYSNFASDKDIVMDATFTASPYHPNHMTADGLRDGYICNNSRKIFHSLGGDKDYLQAKFESEHNITQINVVTSKSAENVDSLYENLEIRVGNYDVTLTKDFSGNNLVARLPSGPSAEAGLFIEYKLDTPLRGSIVTIHKMSGVVPLVVDELQIIEA